MCGLTSALVLAACANPEGLGASATNSAEGVPSAIEVVIPYDVGGGTDLWSRFLTPYLKEGIGGHPTFTIRNVPGGESITGTNQFVQEDVSDGSQILAASGTSYFQALLDRPEVKFDFSKMRPLILNGTGGVIYASADSGIESVEDLLDPPNPLTFASISPTSLDLSMLIALDLLDVDVDATFGFESRGPARLALERGEVNLDYQTTAAYLTQVKPSVEDGDAVALMSFGMVKDGEIVRDPNAPDLPTVIEVYEQLHGKKPSEVAYDAYEAFLIAGFVYQKGLWATEDTPDAVVEPFYEAADELNKDSEFQEKSKDVLGGYPLYSGKEAQDDLLEALDIGDNVRQYTLDMLEDDYDTTIE